MKLAYTIAAIGLVLTGAYCLSGCATKGYEICDTPNCATASPVLTD